MQNTALVSKNVAHLYKAPDVSSEVVSQAILGTRVRVEQVDHDFTLVVGEDEYSGWIKSIHLAGALPRFRGQTKYVTELFADVFEKPTRRSSMLTRLVLSTRVHEQSVVGSFSQVVLPGGRTVFVPTSSLGRIVRPSKNLGARVVRNAHRLIGVPYLWGGCSPFGIDCSGLVQLSYRMCGIQLLRDAYMQFDDPRFEQFALDAQMDDVDFAAGELLVFGVRVPRKITHIGIANGDGTFIHAAGWSTFGEVHIDPCSSPLFIDKFIGAARLKRGAR